MEFFQLRGGVDGDSLPFYPVLRTCDVYPGSRIPDPMMFIPDPGSRIRFSIPDPGLTRSRIRIRIKNLDIEEYTYMVEYMYSLYDGSEQTGP
jgi:hypothetical protein